MATFLSADEAAQLRNYERQRHDELAEGYTSFFAPVTALAIPPLLDAVQPAPAPGCSTWRPAAAAWRPRPADAVPT